MRALIIGGSGFVGRHLAKHLVACGDDVIVTQTSVAEQSITSGLECGLVVDLPRTVQTVVLDITDKESVVQLLSVAAPDVIYHLAAHTFVPDGERNPQAMIDVNLTGTLNVLDAIVSTKIATRLLYVSSSEVYGIPRPGSMPLTESSELRPASVYGWTKAAADLAVFQYHARSQVNAVRVRPFTHTGPGQRPSFALASFAKQVAMIKLGKSKPVISVGNLEARRDYSDVADIVRGYREVLLNGKGGAAYNLCSGHSVVVGDCLRSLIEIAKVEVEIVEDPARVRPLDIPEIVGSYQLAKKELGWSPRVDLSGTLHGLLASWLEALGT